MPYDRLPARLRQLIPSERGQEIFRNTVNSQLDNGRSEAVAMASAWAALRRAGFVRDNATGKWERVEKANPTASSVHVPDADWEKDDTYRAPAGARSAARRAIRWKEKYGDKVKGGTQVGWTRASQLANGENLSRETVARMASFFARHKGNEAVDPKYKDEPWRDAGHVMHLAWGGSAGREWSRRIMDNLQKRQLDDDTFTDAPSAVARSMDLGLGGKIHVQDDDGQAFYMPGETHEEYLNLMRANAGLDQEYEDDSDDNDEPVKEGLIERAVSAIIAAIMQHVDVNKSQEVARVLKMDDEQRIVYGWAYVSTEDGKLLVDTQGDSIEPIEMEKMATDFMLNSRDAKVMHKGEVVGTFVHSFPLTNDIMKAFDIHCDREGWLVGMRPNSEELWKAYKSGEYKAFSIGGKAGDVEDYDAA